MTNAADIPNSLRIKWEQRLAKHGLANTQIVEDSVQSMSMEKTEVSSGIQFHQFDDDMTARALELYRHVDAHEARMFHTIPRHPYWRIIPDWARSDISLREIIKALYPRMNTSIKQRKKAAESCAVLYRYFRLMEPASEIATSMSLPVSVLKRRLLRLKRKIETLRFTTGSLKQQDTLAVKKHRTSSTLDTAWDGIL